MSINQLTMFKLWGDFDEDNNDGWNELELKVMNENRDAMRQQKTPQPSIGFKQSTEPKPMNQKQQEG
tara:strand:+ start:312 stop:512 length:201 start_codon:yes stop_codon:yes gene_type:complete